MIVKSQLLPDPEDPRWEILREYQADHLTVLKNIGRADMLGALLRVMLGGGLRMIDSFAECDLPLFAKHQMIHCVSHMRIVSELRREKADLN